MCGGNVVKSVLPVAAAVVGNVIAGPIGGAIGAGLTTKLTGGSTKNSLLSAGLAYLGGNMASNAGIKGTLDFSGNWDKFTGGLNGLTGMQPTVGQTPGFGVGTGPAETLGQPIDAMGHLPPEAQTINPKPIGSPNPSIYPQSMGSRIGSALTSTPALLGMGAAGVLGSGVLDPKQAAEQKYTLPSRNSSYSGNLPDFSKSKPLKRNFYEDKSDLTTAGYRGEHTFFDPNPGFEYARGGAIRRYATGGVADYRPPSSSGGSAEGSRETGSRTANSLGEMLGAIAGGLSMMSPIGLVSGLYGAREGKTPTQQAVENAYNGLTNTTPPGYNAIDYGYDAEASPSLGDPNRSNSNTGVDFGYDNEAAAASNASSTDSAMGGHGGNSNGQGGSDPDGNGNWAEGGAISGPGGGMDDLVKAVINGETPARLSDGEFVIPADVVAMAGDGSTKAGHKKFYDLIADIRRKKYGKAKQPAPLRTSLSELINAG